MTNPTFSSQLRYPPLQEGLPGAPSTLGPAALGPCLLPSDPTQPGSPTGAPGGKEHILLPGDAQHPAPLRLLVCGVNERGLGKEEELGECYVDRKQRKMENFGHCPKEN